MTDINNWTRQLWNIACVFLTEWHYRTWLVVLGSARKKQVQVTVDLLQERYSFSGIYRQMVKKFR